MYLEIYWIPYIVTRSAQRLKKSSTPESLSSKIGFYWVRSLIFLVQYCLLTGQVNCFKTIFKNTPCSVFIPCSCLQGEQASSGSVSALGRDGSHPGHLRRWTSGADHSPGSNHCRHPKRVRKHTSITVIDSTTFPHILATMHISSPLEPRSFELKLPKIAKINSYNHCTTLSVLNS